MGLLRTELQEVALVLMELWIVTCSSLVRHDGTKHPESTGEIFLAPPSPETTSSGASTTTKAGGSSVEGTTAAPTKKKKGAAVRTAGSGVVGCLVGLIVLICVVPL